MKVPRREFLYLAAGAAALSRIARAQTYPTRPRQVYPHFGVCLKYLKSGGA
jgi:hypothetical protein